MRDQLVISRVVRVAAGVFAPGHVGELTQVVPFELVDAVLAETGRVQRRLRELPSRVGVYFLLAMCLFPEVGYLLVWDRMTGALAGLPGARYRPEPGLPGSADPWRLSPAGADDPGGDRHPGDDRRCLRAHRHR